MSDAVHDVPEPTFTKAEVLSLLVNLYTEFISQIAETKLRTMAVKGEDPDFVEGVLTVLNTFQTTFERLLAAAYKDLG